MIEPIFSLWPMLARISAIPVCVTGEVNGCRCLVLQALMQPLSIVKLKVPPKPYISHFAIAAR